MEMETGNENLFALNPGGCPIPTVPVWMNGQGISDAGKGHVHVYFDISSFFFHPF